MLARWSVAFGVCLAACAVERPPPIEEVVPFTDGGACCTSRSDARPPATTTPYPHADLTVVLPFDGPEQRADVTLPAVNGLVDVHLAIDTTSSFSGEIAELQGALVSSVIPQLRSRVPSLTLGVSRFEDMPFAPFGGPSDLPFRLVAQQTSDIALVNAAVRSLDHPLGFGGDGPEAWIEALYQIATGEGLAVNGAQLAARFAPLSLPDSGRLGGVGFRDGSTRVAVLVTDAPPHDAADYAAVVPAAHSSVSTIAALRRLGVRVAGIASGRDARAALESMATSTGAVVPPSGGVCPTGLGGQSRPATGTSCPVVFDIDGSGEGLSQSVVETISRLLDAVVFGEVHGEAMDDTSRFVQSIEATTATPPDGTTAPDRADHAPAGMPDGVVDTFVDVHTSTVLGFTLHLRNTSVRAVEWPQVTFLHVVFTGDGQVLRDMLVRVIVPEGPKTDAGPVARSDSGGDGGSASSDADASDDLTGPPGPDGGDPLDATAGE